MLGWYIDCLEKLLQDKFGVELWKSVKTQAGVANDNDRYEQLECYEDSITWKLLESACATTGLSREELLEALGEFFFHSQCTCQPQPQDSFCTTYAYSDNLQDWLSSYSCVNQTLWGPQVSQQLPQFFCQQEQQTQTLLLHCWAPQGSLWTHFVQGFVSEAAAFLFQLQVQMQPLQHFQKQDSCTTSWKISTREFNNQWKLCNRISNNTTTCPITGLTAVVSNMESNHFSSSLPSLAGFESESTNSTASDSSTTASDNVTDTSNIHNGIGLSPGLTKSLFPYHIMIDTEFQIQQVGNQLPSLLNRSHNNLLHKNIGLILKPIHPITQGKWYWQWLSLQQEQTFELETILKSDTETDTDSPIPFLRFQTTIVHVTHSPTTTAMLILTPHTQSMQDLRQFQLALHYLPLHSGHRELILAKEQLSAQTNNTQTMAKLQQSLEREKELLESLLPPHAAEGLRAGKTVEPRLHEQVTFFFSDIVSFTNTCEHLEPAQVIDMLNQLYSIMDFLCGKFNLFKVETIGDAYVACSGLPSSDANHARNVANFAVAVSHCCSQVLSPLDNETPIQLRIGLHTGSCASGVVGTTNPRYCVFGSTVNQTSRHESTGIGGKIHCSSTTKEELVSPPHKGLFELEERGRVKMKGVGEVTTYWLSGSENNPDVNCSALEALAKEAKAIVAKTSFTRCPSIRRFSDVSREVKLERSKRMSLARSISLARTNSVSVGDSGEPMGGPPMARPMTRVGSTLGRIGSSSGSFCVSNKISNSNLKTCPSPCTNSNGTKRKLNSGIDSQVAPRITIDTNSSNRKKRRKSRGHSKSIDTMDETAEKKVPVEPTTNSGGMMLGSAWDKVLE